MKFNQVLHSCLIISLIALSNAAFPVKQPRENVWETLANASGLDTICLTHSKPKKPFTTCLVGLPADKWQPSKHVQLQLSRSSSNPKESWDIWTKSLPKAPQEPQELEILASVKMKSCVMFNSPGLKRKKNKVTDVTPDHEIYRNATSWCNSTVELNTPSNQAPLQLPRGMFLICGNRIWPAIPSNVTGGPCSIGKLSLLMPDAKMIKQHKRREKRFIDQYASDCNDKFSAWNFGQRFTAALLLPGAAAGVALRQLDQLGCWLSKNSHAVSLALSDMLTDVQSVRQATLQNRAAIDYLLLAHGHGCEEFEGMCCMNLSDHSKSIHESIQQLQDGIAKLGEESGSLLDDMFNWFSLAPLWRKILKIGSYVLIIIVILLVFIPCILHCAKRSTDKVAKEVFPVQTEGGDVGIQSARNISLPLLERKTPLDNVVFDLYPWRKLPTIWEELKSTQM